MAVSNMFQFCFLMGTVVVEVVPMGKRKAGRQKKTDEGGRNVVICGRNHVNIQLASLVLIVALVGS